jgi:hypothetical protein
MAHQEPTKDHVREEIQFRQLLEEAVSKPGTLMQAYSLFWNYSLGNQILALFQADRRGIALGPIASFNRWKEAGMSNAERRRLNCACLSPSSGSSQRRAQTATTLKPKSP